MILICLNRTRVITSPFDLLNLARVNVSPSDKPCASVRTHVPNRLPKAMHNKAHIALFMFGDLSVGNHSIENLLRSSAPSVIWRTMCRRACCADSNLSNRTLSEAAVAITLLLLVACCFRLFSSSPVLFLHHAVPGLLKPLKT